MFQHDLTFILVLSVPLSLVHFGATYNGPIDTKLLQEEDLLLADPVGHVTVYEGSAFDEIQVSEEESEVGTENYFETGSVHNTTFTDLEGLIHDRKNNYTRQSVIPGQSDEASPSTSIIVAVIILVVVILCAAAVITKLLYERYMKRNDRKDPTDYDSDEYSVMMTWD